MISRKKETKQQNMFLGTNLQTQAQFKKLNDLGSSPSVGTEAPGARPRIKQAQKIKVLGRNEIIQLLLRIILRTGQSWVTSTIPSLLLQAELPAIF